MRPETPLTRTAISPVQARWYGDHHHELHGRISLCSLPDKGTRPEHLFQYCQNCYNLDGPVRLSPKPIARTSTYMHIFNITPGDLQTSHGQIAGLTTNFRIALTSTSQTTLVPSNSRLGHCHLLVPSLSIPAIPRTIVTLPLPLCTIYLVLPCSPLIRLGLGVRDWCALIRLGLGVRDWCTPLIAQPFQDGEAYSKPG